MEANLETNLSELERKLYEKVFERIKLDVPPQTQTAFIPIIGGGQILAEDGTSKTRLARYILNKVLEESSLRTEILSPDSYLFDYPVGLREAKPDCYDWQKIILDIRKLKGKETTLIQDPTNCRLTQKQIGPLDIIIFEGIYSCFTPELERMADFTIGVIEKDEEYLKREVARLTAAPYNNKKGYASEEVLNIFVLTQFSVKKDYFSREIQKANLILKMDEDPPRIYQRRI